MLDVYPSTVCRCLKKMGVKRRSTKKAGHLASEKGRLKNKHEVPKSCRNMTKEKAYILGVMCGDGYLHRTKNGSYQVALQAVDEDFISRFASCLNIVYGLHPSIIKLKARNPKWSPQLCARLCCKEVFTDILRYARFGKYEWKVPSIIFGSSRVLKCSFLKGFFDSEGSVDNSKKITAVSVNWTGLKNIKALLLSLGIGSNISEDSCMAGNRRKKYTIRITGRENIELYNQNIGFGIARKQNKLEDMKKKL